MKARFETRPGGRTTRLLRRPAWPRPDFIAPQASGRWAGWGLAVAGLLVLGTAAQDAWTLHEATRDAEGRLQRWEQEARALRRVAAAAPPAAPAIASRAPDEAARRRAWQIAAALAHPWPELFGATEGAAVPGLQWQRLQHDATTGEVRLEGRSTLPLAALPVVERLQGRPGWQDVVLVRLDSRDGGPVRFELQARLAAPAAEGVR